MTRSAISWQAAEPDAVGADSANQRALDACSAVLGTRVTDADLIDLKAALKLIQQLDGWARKQPAPLTAPYDGWIADASQNFADSGVGELAKQAVERLAPHTVACWPAATAGPYSALARVQDDEKGFFPQDGPDDAAALAHLVALGAAAHASAAALWCTPLSDAPARATALLEAARTQTRDDRPALRLAALRAHACLDGELAAVARGGQLPRAQHVALEAMDPLLHAARTLLAAGAGGGPDALAPVLCGARALDAAHRLGALAHAKGVSGDGVKASAAKRLWQDAAKEAFKKAREGAVPKGALGANASRDERALAACASLITLRLVAASAAIQGLRDENVGREVAGAAFRALKGALTMAVTGGASGASAVVGGIGDAFGVALRGLKTSHAERLSLRLRAVDLGVEAVTTRAAWRWSSPPSDVQLEKELLGCLRMLERDVLPARTGAEESAERWEPIAHYALHLARICARRELPAALRLKVWRGDGDVRGLKLLLEHGLAKVS